MSLNDSIVICCNIGAHTTFMQQLQIIVFCLLNAPHATGMEGIPNHTHNAAVGTLVQCICQREKLLFLQHLLKPYPLCLWRIHPNLLPQKIRPCWIPKAGGHARADKRKKGAFSQLLKIGGAHGITLSIARLPKASQFLLRHLIPSPLAHCLPSSSGPFPSIISA